METPPLGLPRGTVRLVDYDARWPELFENAAAELRACLGARIVGVEHIGSTAVRGLPAKPILDLMAGVPSLQLPSTFFSDLRQIGYEHRRLDTVSGRLFFAKESGNARTHNLSVCEHKSSFWRERIEFRDRLRADKILARNYGLLKRKLARRFSTDRMTYATYKEHFILSALRKAGNEGE